MRSIRVITAELPGILDDIVEGVFHTAGDIHVLARASTRAELLALAQRVRPDVVLMGLDDAGAWEVGWELYVGDPLLRVVGIVGDGRHAFAYELRPHREALGELSPDDLVAVVRRMAGSRLAAGSLSGERG